MDIHVSLNLGERKKLPVSYKVVFVFNLNILKELLWIANDDPRGILELLKEKNPL